MGERVVWVAEQKGVEGGSLIAVYADRESAMAWLRMKHNQAQREAAQTTAYWQAEYAERAAQEQDPEMREYYRHQSASTEWLRDVEGIREYPTGAAFNYSRYDRYAVNEEVVRTFTTPKEPTDV